MDQVNLRRDGFVLGLLIVMLVMLFSALTGAYRAFGYALVLFLGMMSALGFVRRTSTLTWVPPIVASSVLLISFVGMFAYEAAPVHAVGDTRLGFQRGTAFLIYGVWLPAFFTLGVGFSVMFDRLQDHSHRTHARRGDQP